MSAWRTEAPDRAALLAVSVAVGGAPGGGAREVALATATGPLAVSLHAQGARIRKGGRRGFDYGMLAADPEPLACTVRPEADATGPRPWRWPACPCSGAWARRARAAACRLTPALEETAVFAREGAAIPLGLEVRRTAELDGGCPVAETWRAA